MSDSPVEDGFAAHVEALVRALLADLDTVMAALDPERQERLRALVADVGERSAKQVLLELQELLLWADLPSDHPVMRALSSDKKAGLHGARATMTPDDALNLLRVSMRAGPELSAERSEPLPPHGSYDAVIQRLRAVPSLDTDEVRRAGVDPELPDLIRLPDGASVKLPRFQFDALGVRAVVLEVNRVLGAEQDPWGVASWWTDLHAWLGRAPVELLDEDDRVEDLGRLAWAEVAD